MKVLYLAGCGIASVWMIYTLLCAAIVMPQYTIPARAPGAQAEIVTNPGALAEWVRDVSAWDGERTAPVECVVEAAQPVPPQPTVAPPPPAAVTQIVPFLGAVKLADVGTMVLPEGARVGLTDHAEERHGGEADKARQAVAAAIAAEPILGQQPPCKDGRHRFIASVPGGWAIWVLVKTGELMFTEVTAFITANQSYVRSIHDDCGNGNSSWWGHSYAQ